MLHNTFGYILSNFPLAMLILAILVPMLSHNRFKTKFCTNMFLFAIGFTGIWGFIVHAFYPQIALYNIGWLASPFELEVAFANLAIGITGIIASYSPKSYRTAVALTVTIFLWGAAFGHIYQILTTHNLNPGNAGSILYTDIIIPIFLWISLLMCPVRSHHDDLL